MQVEPRGYAGWGEREHPKSKADFTTVVAAINEFERANLLERQREGIAIAKREGKYKGRKAVTVPDLPRHYARYQRREVSKAALARELGISRPTLDRLFSAYDNS